jgi:hypothetical protein
MSVWGIAIAAGVGAIGSVVASGKQASGQEQAANTQAGMFNTIVGQEQPFMQAGYGATTALTGQYGTAGAPGNAPFTQQDYLANQDPGYQFQLQTGGQALRNADTPGVGSLSGQSLKDLMTFNQGTAATGYQNAFNRYQTQNNNVFARLSGLAGLGQNAASNTGTAGTQLGTGIAQAQAGAAASQAGGIIGAGNAASGAANTYAGLAYLANNNSASAAQQSINAGIAGNQDMSNFPTST